MTPEQHAELLDTLAGIKGTFLLSGYPSRLYARYESRHGWARSDREIDNKSSGTKNKANENRMPLD